MKDEPKFNYNLNKLLESVKGQFDAIPKFDPTLGVVNVHFPKVAYFTAESFSRHKIPINQISEYLEGLKSIGAIVSYDFDKEFHDTYVLSLPENFEKLYSKIRKTLEIIDEGGKTSIIQKLFFDRQGNMWKEPKDKFNLKFRPNQDRYKILRFLASNHGYHTTEVLNAYINKKDKNSLYIQINSIRKNITGKLKIKGSSVIESEQGLGYRNNPHYPIILSP